MRRAIAFAGLFLLAHLVYAHDSSHPRRQDVSSTDKATIYVYSYRHIRTLAA
jgi:hypothetical protein